MNPQNLKNIFSGLVGLVYLGVGVMAIVNKQFIGIPIHPTAAILVGLLMVAYGCFRIYRAVKA